MSTEATFNEKLEIIEKYRAAFWKDSDDDYAQQTLADSYLLAGHQSQAISLYKSALCKRGSDARLHASLAEAYSATGEFGNAAYHFCEAARCSHDAKNDYEDAVFETIYILEEASLERAVEAMQRIVNAFPGNALYKQELARISWRNGDLDHAVKFYREVVDHRDWDSDKKHELLESLAAVYEDKGAFVEALSILQIVLEETDELGEREQLLMRIASNFTKSGKHSEAVEIFEAFSNKRIPLERKPHYLLSKAMCLEESSPDAAIRTLIEILTITRDESVVESSTSGTSGILCDSAFFAAVFACLKRSYISLGASQEAKAAEAREAEYSAKLD